MTRTRATTLTIAFDHGRRTRRRTFTDVRYGVTWNRVDVTLPDGGGRVYDRLHITDLQATNNHAARAA